MKIEVFSGESYKQIAEPVVGKAYYFRQWASTTISLSAFYLGKDLTRKYITQVNAVAPICLFDFCYELVLTPKKEIEAVIAALKADKDIITRNQIIDRLEQIKQTLCINKQ